MVARARATQFGATAHQHATPYLPRCVSMTVSLVKELYNSPNGDRWVLCKDSSGKLVVSHHPNNASGGRPSEIGVDVFLSQGGHGPEHQALVDTLASLETTNDDNAQQELSVEATEKISRALGQAVARCWSSLPQEIQQNLFDAAVKSEGETIRQQLAVYLHGKHQRTVDTKQPQAMPEPDSLGG
jgi:hypothetical protein